MSRKSLKKRGGNLNDVIENGSDSDLGSDSDYEYDNIHENDGYSGSDYDNYDPDNKKQINSE